MDLPLTVPEAVRRPCGMAGLIVLSMGIGCRLDSIHMRSVWQRSRESAFPENVVGLELSGAQLSD